MTSARDPYQGFRALERAVAAGGRPADDPNEDLRPIDQIAIRRTGGFVFVDLQGWIGMLRSEQSDLLKEQRVTFLSDGEKVPVRNALRWIQQQR